MFNKEILITILGSTFFNYDGTGEEVAKLVELLETKMNDKGLPVIINPKRSPFKLTLYYDSHNEVYKLVVRHLEELEYVEIIIAASGLYDGEGITPLFYEHNHIVGLHYKI